MDKLLIVDDSEEIRQQLKWGLAQEYRLSLAEDGHRALELFRQQQPAVVTLDLGLPPDPSNASEGLRCLKALLDEAPQTKVIVITGNEEHANALKAIELGAYDYYAKPIVLDELKVILQRACHLTRLEEELTRLRQQEAFPSSYAGMVGQGEAIQKVFRTIDKVASYDAPVMILGENGTGKEMVARAIHSKSAQRKGPFIAINCGAIPENLLESELFGHERGAFTGADRAVAGKVEYAEGGTLFLDEIGELPPALQVKLLRFLQEKTIQRVGGRSDIPVNVRILAATNVDVTEAIRQGRLREDLYYRIGMVSIALPPLRDRRDDIPVLAHFFMDSYAAEIGKSVRGFSRRALAALLAYGWPGNVRELENRVKRAVIMAESRIIEPEDLDLGAVDVQLSVVPAATGVAVDGPLTLKEARARLEFDLVTEALEAEEGNIVRAADRLGVSRPTLYDLMKKHGLSAPAQAGGDTD